MPTRCLAELAGRAGSCEGSHLVDKSHETSVSQRPDVRRATTSWRGEEDAPTRVEPTGDGALLTAVLDALDARVRTFRNTEPGLAAFAAWVGALGGARDDVLCALALEAAEHEGAGRHYQDVAILGFACARCAWADPAEGERVAAQFRDGLKWMRGRRFFVSGQPLGFEADGVALMGTAAGICAAAEASTLETDRRWLGDIIAKTLGQTPADTWDRALVRSAAVVLERGDADPRNPPHAPDDLARDLAAALASIGLVILTEDDERVARLAIVDPSFRTMPAERAAVQAAALRWLLRRGATALPRRATVADVVQLLRGVPHALKRWPWEEKPRTSRAGAVAQRWDVQNEYHVQSLLWALLAPIFEDLEDEEYLHSIGHKHPRVDLAIPSLGLIIEVKFMRGGAQGDLAGVIGEVSSDTGLYLSVPSYFTQIVAFVWDDSRSNDQHSELLAGLRKLRGVSDAVVVSRPGRCELRQEKPV